MPIPQLNPVQSFGVAAQPVSAQPSFQNNALAGSGFAPPPAPMEILPPPPPPEMGQSAMNYLPSNAAPGWNDPPVFSKPLRPQVGIL